MANSGMCSPQVLSIEGRKWKGFSSSLSTEDEEDNLLIFNEAEVGVFKIFEEGEEVVGFISFKEDVEKVPEARQPPAGDLPRGPAPSGAQPPLG